MRTKIFEGPGFDNKENKKSEKKPIKGFSKLSKEQKIDYLVENYLEKNSEAKKLLQNFWASNPEEQKLFDEFSENTLSNFYFPFGVCPNVLINNQLHCVPMVIEESSVVAACSKAANFWLQRGGFKAEVIGTEKIGQVHLIWNGESEKLFELFSRQKSKMRSDLRPLLMNMEKRGGGLVDFELRDLTDKEPGYYQIWCTFETCDAMGANFINSVLEALGRMFKLSVESQEQWEESARDLQVVMAILSNYTPDCIVRASVECSLEELEEAGLGMSAEVFVEKFSRAVRISKIDTNRATTHNKGIFNGIDAVVLATGNDFRAVEACGHTYAARDGKYRGLTNVEVKDRRFRFWLDIPLSVGTVGGLTALHPLAKMSLDMLGRPDARQLMMVMAVIGLAQNFAALKSLTTSGIQKGHMKMHLMNILKHLDATEAETQAVKEAFANEVISFGAVREFLQQLRKYQ